MNANRDEGSEGGVKAITFHPTAKEEVAAFIVAAGHLSAGPRDAVMVTQEPSRRQERIKGEINARAEPSAETPHQGRC
jgi:hypothetical protein